MSKYIDRDEAIEALVSDYAYAAASIIEKEIPVANVQKVVRCKDCIYFSKDILEQSVCTRLYPVNLFCMNPDDFCSYGKRK